MWEAYSKIKDISFDIYYCASIEVDRKWKVPRAEGVREHFLKGITFGKEQHFNPSIFKLVKRHDLWLIGGYSMPSAQLLIILCKFLRIPYAIMFDGISPLKIDLKENWIKFAWKKFLVKGCAAWLGNGTIGRLYGKKLGIPDEKIYNQYLTVDVAHFQELLLKKQEIRDEKRKELRIPREAFVILYVGRLVKQKGVQDLIEAVNQLSKKHQELYLLIVGHGEYEEELRKKASKNEKILFIGHVGYEKIHEVYFLSDLFVLPTYNDHWGLVINEAMACGLPVITTTAAGASIDLINADNSLCEPGDINCIAKSILSHIISKNKKTVADRSFETINEWTFENARFSLEKLVEKLDVINHYSN